MPSVVAQWTRTMDLEDLEESDMDEDVLTQVQTRTPTPQLLGSARVISANAVLQFESRIYYCAEEDKRVVLNVSRSWDTSARSTVSYTTVDRSALAGHQYRTCSGVLIFEPGENRKEIVVELIESRSWVPTCEFLVHLQKETMVNARPASVAWEARVRILCRIAFPNSKYEDYILADDLARATKAGLFAEYLKLNMRQPIVRRGTIKTILVDQFENFHFFLRLFIDMYIVDYIADKGSGLELFTNKKVSLIFLMILLVVPFAALHCLRARQPTWKVGGASRMVLQKGLLGRFLEYTEESRSGMREGALIMAITRDVPELVHGGYGNVLAVVRNSGRLVATLMFIVIAPVVVGEGPSWVPLVLSVAFPFPLLLFLYLRNPRSIHAMHVMHTNENEMVDIVDSVVMNYRLIADYSNRPEVTEAFEKSVASFNKASINTGVRLTNDRYFGQWMALLCTVAWTVIGGFMIIDCEDKPDCSFSVGLFLGQIRSVKDCGNAWNLIYVEVVEIVKTMPCFERLVKYLNLRIDFKQRMSLSMQRMKESVDRFKDIGDRNAETIKIENFSAVGHKGVFEIPQGELISFVGPRFRGKTTLLKVIAGAAFPDGDCKVHTPAHLRHVHISHEPLFFHGTFLENLTFGMRKDSDKATMERVLAICRRFALPDHVLDLVSSDDWLAWHGKLSLSQRHLLHMVRGFVYNPQLICLQRPLEILPALTANLVAKTMKDFVCNRGLEVDPVRACKRSARTCIITSSRMQSAEESDRVIYVGDGIKEITKEDLTDEMLQ